jgi:RNA polymerase sigma-70 factor (ECF subfamily)
MTASEEFTSLTVPFRGELLAHCYRMIGSVDEAEDLVPFPDAEAAQLLGTTTTAVNSALRRARAHLVLVLPAQDQLAEPASTIGRELVGRYAAAFENAGVSALVSLLRQDVARTAQP